MNGLLQDNQGHQARGLPHHRVRGRIGTTAIVRWRPRLRARRGAAGWTLLELLIVLALLVTITGMSWPMLHKALRKAELRAAVRQLQAELGKLRLQALETGLPYQVQCELGGSQFQIAPWPGARRDQARVQQGPVPGLAPAPARPTPEDPASSSPVIHQLPDGVTFAGQSREEPRWSAAIRFKPNGQATSARIQLVSGNYRATVQIRGLTGKVTAGEVSRVVSPAAETQGGTRDG